MHIDIQDLMQWVSFAGAMTLLIWRLRGMETEKVGKEVADAVWRNNVERDIKELRKGQDGK